MVTPSEDTKFFNELITNKAELESRPEVGSSKKRHFGRDISSKPIFTRFFSPPDTPRLFTSPTKLFATRESPRFAKVESARSSISCISVPRGRLSLPANMRFSRTVNSAYTTSSWGTKPITSLISSICFLVPLM